MGEVWRARDERLDRYVALKVLPADAAVDVERRARMLREARAAAAIRHANAVTLYDIISHDGDDVLVMELVDGATVAETLRRNGPPALETGLGWILGVADALVAAHGLGILHRDIKAANIMVTATTVKVLDFGLAKMRCDAPLPPSDPDRAPGTSGKLAIAETIRGSGDGNVDSYQTHAGQLLGTPLYMAPEQVEGAAPDERSEVFSVGVLAYEVLTGKPPYIATTVDLLFEQIRHGAPPPLADVPSTLAAIVMRALAKHPAERFTTMAAMRDALAAERARLFAPRARRWPLVVACALLVAGAGAGAMWWRSHRTEPARPGDDYVKRALEEYNVFYNDKALSSLRAALATAPDHPRAIAYLLLFGAPDADVSAAHRVVARTDPQSKDRALLAAAIALAEHGPLAARKALLAAGAASDRELAFWAAELDYRSGQYAAAKDEYKALLASPAPEFRGRIYDHYSSVLLYFDEPTEALEIGKRYRDAFPGEADAVAVYATTLAAAGQLDEAVKTAEDARRLNEGEDTLAGLAKVLALKGDRGKARELYAASLALAGPSRKPVRRAALGFLQWIDGDAAGAKLTVEPCLTGADAAARERGACLFVAGVIDPSRAEEAARELDKLAAEATELKPAYGAPASLAKLVRARTQFFGGGCVIPGELPPAGTVDEAAYAAPLDFYAAYHLPFFATWAICEHAALYASRNERARAADLLGPVATRAPNRRWLLESLRRYQP